MKILHVIAGMPPEGGMAESVPTLSLYLRRLGHEVVLATLSGSMSEAATRAEQEGVRLIRFVPSWPRCLYFSWQMLMELNGLCEDADVVHVHGAWTFPVWWGGYCALRTRKPLIRSPRGCLAPARLRRSTWKKRIAGVLCDNRFLRKASVIHVTCEAERHEAEMYFQKMERALPPIAMVPNGIEVDAWQGSRDRSVIDQKWVACRGKRVVLFLGRINPIKGLDLLVKAWRNACLEDWHLLIVGPDEHGYRACVETFFDDTNTRAQVTFGDPVYGEEKREVMRAADIFILPTYNENFGIAVAEALAAGVPVITTKGAPWSELASECCGWWVDIGVEPLANALRDAMNLTDEERRGMGENGQRLVERKYQWKTVVNQMVELYETIVK